MILARNYSVRLEIIGMELESMAADVDLSQILYIIDMQGFYLDKLYLDIFHWEILIIR